MMSVLDRYVAKWFIQYFMVAMLLVIGIDAVFQFMDELRSIGVGHYTVKEAMLVVLMSMLPSIGDWAPVMLVMSAGLTITALSYSKELWVMLLASYSMKRLQRCLMLTAFLLLAPLYVLQFSFIPEWSLMIQEYKNTQMAKNTGMVSKSGFWFVDGHKMIYFRQKPAEDLLSDIEIYTLDANDTRIELVQHARHAIYRDDQWIMQEVSETKIDMEGLRIESRTLPEVPLVVQSPSLFRVLEVPALEDQSLAELEQLSVESGLREEIKRAARYAKLGRLSFPILPIGLIGLLMPLAVLAPRTTMVSGFGISGLFGLLYYVLGQGSIMAFKHLAIPYWGYMAFLILALGLIRGIAGMFWRSYLGVGRFWGQTSTILGSAQ